jgi:hypothetical protein
VEKALLGDGVIVDSRPGRLRLSPHWALTEEELDHGMDLVIHHLHETVDLDRPVEREAPSHEGDPLPNPPRKGEGVL